MGKVYDGILLRFIQDNFEMLDPVHEDGDEFVGFYFDCGDFVFEVREIGSDGYTVLGTHTVKIDDALLHKASVLFESEGEE